MGRELKFRAFLDATEYDEWHPDYGVKRMLSHEEIMDGTDDFRCYLNNEISGVSALMQFTGLHDKNGREVYEGDIFKNPIPVVVEYSDRHAGYVFSPEKCGVVCYDVSQRWANKSKIIGNIYENPELLEKGAG